MMEHGKNIILKIIIICLEITDGFKNEKEELIIKVKCSRSIITGGAGFIGNSLVNRLSKNKKNKIFVIDLKKKINKLKKVKNVKYIEGDVSNLKIFNRIKSQASHGTGAGQWSARKAQALAKAYKKAGGGYK